jgi:DNA-binding response OmpR family regulator
MADKILIVDDEIETLKLVGLMLQRQGYHILAASNGKQALAIAKQELPDLIVLDVMMPDLDGYEVTRQLRADAATATIPILMFSAKSQVDDKVIGYEAGVDDYLTKPVHPAELTAHIRVLLSRTTKSRPKTSPSERGRVIVALSVKGGLGVSTTVLNTCISLQQKQKVSVVAVEIRLGQGGWASELGYPKPEGLNRLLRLKTGEINQETVERELILHNSGVRLLLSSTRMKDVDQYQAIPQLEAIIGQLSQVTPVVMLDIGTNIFSGIDRILSLCNEVMVITEPHPVTVARTKIFLDDLNEKGFGRAKALSIVLVHHTRSDIQYSWSQVQDTLQMPITQIVSPVPELAYQATIRTTPILISQPECIASTQYNKLAETLAQRVRKPA